MAVRIPAATFAVAHLVFPYLLVNMILSTPSYSPEKIGASMMITARASAIKKRTMFLLVESQPST